MRSPFVTEWFTPAAGPPEYEVIPPDERVRIRDTLQVPFRWVCSLDVTRGSTLFRGSGLLVGPRHVLTAAHNIYNARGERPDTVYVAPARNGADLPFGRFKASGFTVSSRYLRQPRPGSRFDVALVSLERDASAIRSRALSGAQLGHWGSSDNGALTDLSPLDSGFLSGRPVTVCGFPGDKCDGDPCDPARGWTREQQANTMWSHYGSASFSAARPGIILYTADTSPGQSGSPVWIRFTSGRRSLVGVHVDAQRVTDATTGVVTVTANRGVFLDKDLMALVRSWLGR
ncbi:trypsin-like serine protease [Kribbella pittospori]|uniref:Serine protease n=1 Tax=Kribbella pittospori TaxID=722689 RepID=A0A4R0KQY5_9ACTN|nr:trypsin-like peptidase domain-containing protein [Kribbella pittospori]TCC63303.1 trypsin-like serine protease [Kribbella pittospori]